MPFGIKILIAVLGLGVVTILGSTLWGNLKPCTSSPNTATTSVSSTAATAAAVPSTSTSTDPCTSSTRSRLRSIFNSRSTTGGGTDVGK